MFNLTTSRWRHPLPWLLLLIGYSLWQQADGWLGLFDGQNWRQMGNFLATSWPPRFDRDFLALTLTATLESLAVATLGLAGALLLGVPFALLGSRALSLAELGPVPSPLRGALRGLSRLVAIVLRSLPELIWALLFVRLSGLGPLAAILAIAVSYGGMLAKVYNEIMESGAQQPARALLLGGSGRLQALWYGVLPAVRQELLSYTVYRWECALRASVIMGFVGAGGLGQQLELSLRMFAGGEVVTLLLAFILLVTLADGLSAWLRHSRSPGLLLLICLGLAAALALYQLDWRMLSFSLSGLGSFVEEFLRPDWSWPFLKTVASGLLDTVQMALLSTLFSALLALPLACLARHCWPLRLLFNLLRSVPELIFASLLVIAVGLGPVAGILALTLHTTGVLARLFVETLENADPAPRLALQLSGAGPIASFWYGLFPLVTRQWLAYSLYRGEMNLRAATILGVVGAGGLGQQLYVSLSLFRYDQTATLLLAILLLVWLAEAISRRTRLPRPAPTQRDCQI
ncbi:phosphonate ABC transporter, permease protein PhnE [Aeromonas enteropelogenes]|uniref:phosphonate ABC transporter, permease protein PhnE n=1 Tax=Aeromonas enteropelogenes TaxID=29489 RepID=UPI002B2ED2F3|nr:phosphonate ABC transporter, permease protein PhnE [Aeromonas enteropelogenes]BEE20025.1 phosphonate ABC transporter, permease protein PhnE [Aeromonas enteropelogenes]